MLTIKFANSGFQAH